MSALKALRLSCFLSCLLLLGCNSGDANRKALAQKIAQGIPLQSTPAQVLGYLDGQRIKHSQYLHDPWKGNSVLASVPYDSHEWRVVYTSYGISFLFDGHDRLTSSEIHPEYTGP